MMIDAGKQYVSVFWPLGCGRVSESSSCCQASNQQSWITIESLLRTGEAETPMINCLFVMIPCEEGAAAQWNSGERRGLLKSLLIKHQGCQVWNSCPVQVDACGWCLDSRRNLEYLDRTNQLASGIMQTPHRETLAKENWIHILLVTANVTYHSTTISPRR